MRIDSALSQQRGISSVEYSVPSKTESLVAASPVELGRIVWAGWPVVLGTIAAVMLLAAAYLYYFAEKKYTATGSLMIEPPATLYPTSPGLAEPSNLDKSAIISQAEALRSRDLLQRVAKRLVSEGLLVTASRKPLVPSFSPAQAAAVNPQESVIDHLQHALAISVVDDSHVINAEVTDARPVFAGRALTLLFNEYIQREVDRREAVNAAAREQYTARSEALKNELESLNQRIAAQTVETGRHFEGGTTILFGSMQTAVNQLNELDAELADVNAKIKVVGAAVDSGNGAVVAGILDAPNMKTIVQNQVDLQLEAQAMTAAGKGEQHPDSQAIQKRRVALNRLQADEMQHSLAELNQSRSQLLEQSRQVRARIAVLQSGSDRESQGTAALDQLQKSADALREMLNQVVGRLYDTSTVPNANAWIIAAPTVLAQPTSPRVGITMIGAGLLGLIAGAMATFWREGRRRAAKSVLEIYPAAVMPALWNLPSPKQKLLAGRNHASFEKAKPKDWHETLRAIGHRLTLKGNDGRGTAVAVVSAQPNEGKTMVALTLSRTLASDGYRVLLIDGDLRKPDIHRSSGTSMEGSLHSLLREAGDWHKLINRDRNSPLHLIVPTEPSDPSTGFLRDGRIRQLVEAAQRDYDFVVVDTSPVRSVADALFFLDCVQSAILVSGERTHPRETQRVLAQPGFPLEKVEGVIRFGRGGGPLSYPGY